MLRLGLIVTSMVAFFSREMRKATIVNETGYKLRFFKKLFPTFLYEPLSFCDINLESKLTTLSVLFVVSSKFPPQKFTSV
jgi:hypothetical protein